MSTQTTTDTSKQCQITNNSTQSSNSSNGTPTGYDIVIGTPFKSDVEKENTTGAILSSARNFEVLALTGGTSTVITKGSSGTVTLDRSYTTDNGTTYKYEYGYDLLISSAGWFVPLANIAVEQNIYPAGFDPITVTADDFEGMKQTQDFYQTVAAFPTSALAQGYAAAMTKTSDDATGKADGSDGSTQNVGDSIAAGEAAFFQNTQNYKKVTADQICLLEFYYNNFPFVWAKYDSATYYIYSNSDDGSTTTFAGTLSLTKPAAIDITKPNAGYICTFNPAVNPSDLSKTDVDTSQAKSLTYADGIFTEDNSANPDLPAIALKGAFGLKRTFTKVSTDQTVIVVISGTINGLKSMGFDEAQVKTADNATQDWLNSLFHPTTAAGIFNSVMTILGALMMLHFVATAIYGIVKWVRTQLSGPDPKTAMTQDDVQNLKTENANLKAQNQKLMDKLSSGKETLPDNTVDAQAKASTETSSLSDQVSKGQFETSAEKMNESLKSLEKCAPEMTSAEMTTLQSSATDLRDALSALESATTPEELKAALDQVRPKMASLSENISNLNTEVSAKVAGEQQTEIKDNQQTMEDVQEAVDEEAKVADNEATDTGNADPDAETVEFPDM